MTKESAFDPRLSNTSRLLFSWYQELRIILHCLQDNCSIYWYFYQKKLEVNFFRPRSCHLQAISFHKGKLQFSRCRWVCGGSLAETAGSNPAGGMVIFCEYCGLSSRGFCFGLITRPEESYRVWCV